MRKLFALCLAAVLSLPGVASAQVAISALPAASTPSGTEVLPIVQAGVTKKATIAQVRGTPTSGSSILSGNGAGGFSNVTIGSGCTFTSGTLSCAGTGGSGTVTSASVVSANGFAGTVANPTTTPAFTLSTTITGVLKGNGTAISAAVSGTDYAPATSGSSILKGNGSGGFSSATSGTDYAPATSGGSLLYGNGSGGFSNVTIGSGLSFSTGTLSATGGGGGTVTTTGSPATGNLATFSGASSITNADLTGDVTTSGGVATTLAASGVTAGSCTSCNLTIDAKGRVTAQANGSGSASFTGVKAYNDGTQAISNATVTAITFASNELGSSSIHSTSSNTDRFVATSAGNWVISYHVNWSGSATNTRYSWLQKNGTTSVIGSRSAISGTFIVGYSLSVVVNLAVNDYVRLMTYQDSGGTLNAGSTIAAEPADVNSVSMYYLGS